MILAILLTSVILGKQRKWHWELESYYNASSSVPHGSNSVKDLQNGIPHKESQLSKAKRVYYEAKYVSNTTSTNLHSSFPRFEDGPNTVLTLLSICKIHKNKTF